MDYKGLDGDCIRANGGLERAGKGWKGLDTGWRHGWRLEMARLARR